jgi:hypothetical protein
MCYFVIAMLLVLRLYMYMCMCRCKLCRCFGGDLENKTVAVGDCRVDLFGGRIPG